MHQEPFSPPPARPPREPLFNLPRLMLIMVVSLVGIHAVVSVLDPATELGLIFGYGFVPGAWTLWMFPGAEESILEQVIVDGAVDPRAATMVRMGLIEHPNSIFRSTDLRPAARLMVACTSERPVAGGLRNPGASTPRRGALHCAVCRQPALRRRRCPGCRPLHAFPSDGRCLRRWSRG